jgi:hypothetical protein
MTKPRLLMLLAIAAFAGGAFAQFFEPDKPLGPVTLTATFVGVFLMFLWFRADADERQFARSALLNVAVVAVAVFALPVYFFRTRGAKGGAIATFLFLLAAIGWSALQWLGAIFIYVAVQR